ncbi:MAG TPA: holo-ACP synthase [Edaphobacter sp.]|nr:holo-ACP synthase [Edaphobacter sp.]
MIVGIGTDMIEISRIEQSIEQFGERFLDRIFTAGEISYCRQKKKHSAESFAARFAAKEAAAKALGTGISRGISWKEIEVQRQPGGPPTLHLFGRAREIADRLGIGRLSLSLTHSRDLALAVAIAEK